MQDLLAKRRRLRDQTYRALRIRGEKRFVEFERLVHFVRRVHRLGPLDVRLQFRFDGVALRAVEHVRYHHRAVALQNPHDVVAGSVRSNLHHARHRSLLIGYSELLDESV